jgi:2,3-bisphosphoglycerate-dependent phosphoglycerate mutase
MADPRLILVRHAESAPDFARRESEWPLSGRGVAQAEQLAERLASQRIDRIYSSPYARALETVRPLSLRTGVPIEICDDLRERKLSDGPLPDFLDVIERSWRDFDLAPPGCESARMAQRRAVSTIAQLAEPDRIVLISSHGQFLSLFLNARDPSFGFEAWRAMPNPHVIFV